MKGKTVMIISVVIGLLLYIRGFIFISKLNAMLMGSGGLLIFIPIMIIGIFKRKDKKILSNILIGISAFFILVLTLTTTIVIIAM